MKKINVLDKGYVELIDYMGSDRRILETARISTGSEPDKGDASNRGLIRYLYTNQHSSPFEQCVFTFKIKTPVAIARQWMRHRTGSYNEYSLRYSEAITDYYIPEEFREQGKINHQGSGNAIENSEMIKDVYSESFDEIMNTYKGMIEEGVAREQARMILPVGLYTEFYMTMNLSNLFKFIALRRHPHAQKEIYVYADAILKILKEVEDLKYSVEIFEDINEVQSAYTSALNKYRKEEDGFLQLKEHLLNL